MSVSAAIAYAQAAPAIDEPPLDIAAQRALAPVALVACCAGKRSRPAIAADLYTSDLFRRSRAYAERLGGPWRILSARHHLLAPDKVVAPYDCRLDDLPPAALRTWAVLVANAMRLEGFSGRRVVMLAGRLYRAELIGRLEAMGCEISVPMEGLGIGSQRKWLGEQLAIGGAQ